MALGRNTLATHSAIRAYLHYARGKSYFFQRRQSRNMTFFFLPEPTTVIASPIGQSETSSHSFRTRARQGQLVLFCFFLDFFFRKSDRGPEERCRTGGDSVRRSRPRIAAQDAECDNTRVPWEGVAEPEETERVRTPRQARQSAVVGRRFYSWGASYPSSRARERAHVPNSKPDRPVGTSTRGCMTICQQSAVRALE